MERNSSRVKISIKYGKRWAGHVTHIEQCIQDFWWESQKERKHYGNLGICGRIILKWILKRYCGVLWTGLI
jgi:hypothetical protein